MACGGRLRHAVRGRSAESRYHRRRSLESARQRRRADVAPRGAGWDDRGVRPAHGSCRPVARAHRRTHRPMTSSPEQVAGSTSSLPASARLGNARGVDWHLAQVNIGRLRAPVGDPIIADFVAALDPINALADSAPGFIWRLQTEDGNATAIRPVADDGLVAINLSVWETVEALADFV